MDATEWRGKTLTISVAPERQFSTWEDQTQTEDDREVAVGELLSAIRTSPEIWSRETLYKEQGRPMFHFTAARGWSNDPNGLVYHNGQYHMFFQHNPFGLRWGNIHWGHAVSEDLVHWRELPIAIYPRGDDFPYSGSAVVDHENKSGRGSAERPPLIIAFTSTGRGECLAFSQDGGMSWKELDGNPVIEHDGRDPRLLWHQRTGRWVIAVYSEQPGPLEGQPPRRGIAFYTSVNLATWVKRSWIEGYYECPDLYELPVDGDADRKKWVLSCASGSYTLGEFDGERFLPDGTHLPAPAGGRQEANGCFPPSLLWAAQTFGDHPDGRRVEIAWALVYTQDAPFTQLMSFPSELSLQTTEAGIRLCRKPVHEIEALRTRTFEQPPGPLTSLPLLTDLEGEGWDIEAVIKTGTISPILLSIGGDEYVYQVPSQMLSGPNGFMMIPRTDGRLRLRILVDRTTVEIFGDLGQAYGMFLRRQQGGNAALALRTWDRLSEVVHVERLSVHALRSAWLDMDGPEIHNVAVTP